MRRKPYSVVLLDEIEKAHPEVFNVLLQVLDEGRLTDSKGRTVDFKNTIIIMTSNLGSQVIREKVAADFRDNGNWDEVFVELKQELFRVLQQTIRPEFLNRIDDIIVFKPLSGSDIRRIVTLQLRGVEEMLQKRGIVIEVTDEAKDLLARLGYDPTYGARPLKRVIQKHVVNTLSQKILQGEFESGDSVEIGVDGKGLVNFVKKGGESVRRTS